jgi:hypothetical protein
VIHKFLFAENFGFGFFLGTVAFFCGAGGGGGFSNRHSERERERELGGEKKVIGFVEEVLGRSFYGNSLRYS